MRQFENVGVCIRGVAAELSFGGVALPQMELYLLCCRRHSGGRRARHDCHQ